MKSEQTITHHSSLITFSEKLFTRRRHHLGQGPSPAYRLKGVVDKHHAHDNQKTAQIDVPAQLFIEHQHPNIVPTMGTI